MERKYKRVILIGSDGCGTYFREANTPNMDRIFKNGAITYSAITSFPSISAECWGSMLHGVAPEYHMLTNSIVGTIPYNLNSPYPSVFKLIREKYPDANMAAFTNWRSINTGIIEDGLGVFKASNGDDSVVTDSVVEYIKENDFDFIFVQFDQTDGAGHKNGYGTQAHLDQIELSDSYIGRIYEAMKQTGRADDALIIVTTDHGGTAEHCHGGASPEEMTICIAAAGKGVVKGEMYDKNGISVRDISAMVLYAFGIEVPDCMDAVVPERLFEGYTHVVSQKRERIPVTQEYNRPILDKNKSLQEYIDSGVIRSIIHFDGDAKDSLGNSEPQENGEIKYVDGIKGKAVDLSNGHISLGFYKLGLDSFSISFWIKQYDDETPAMLVGNRDMSKEAFPGFAFETTKDGIVFTAGNGVFHATCSYPFPYLKKREDGWRHITLSVNHRAQNIVVYNDFEKSEDQLFHSGLVNATFDSLELCIGQDGSQKYPNPLKACIDELVIFNGAIVPADMEALKELYNNIDRAVKHK